jgi:hypothetical protein
MRKSNAHAAREVTLRSLMERAEGQSPPLDTRIDVAKRLLTAIARMHERQRVHGSLDPSAIRLSGVRSFRVDVIGEDDAPASGIRDTRYAPPEGERSMHGDVYSVGLILGELLADAPVALRTVIAVMTERDPQARYANAQVAMCAFARVAPSGR